jgi:hypothetical protein
MIYRSKNAVLSIITFSTVIAIGSILGYEPSLEFMRLYISGLTIVPILITLWLYVFNSGTTRIDEYAIEFSSEGIDYQNMAEKETIAWSDYEKYEVSGIVSKTLTICGKSKRMSIDLMIFNSSQRKSIISTLNERC